MFDFSHLFSGMSESLKDTATGFGADAQVKQGNDQIR